MSLTYRSPERGYEALPLDDRLDALMLEYRLVWWLVPLSVFGLLAAGGCGSDGPSARMGSPATVTAIVPASRVTGAVLAIESVDYSFDCGSGRTPEPRPTLERVGGFLDSRNQSQFWKGTIDYPPGECELLVVGRDPDGEAICTARRQLADGESPPRDLYLEMVCGFCFCELDGDATITVETLAAQGREPAAGVAYTFTCNGGPQLAFPETLQRVGMGTVQLNGQSLPTDIWEDTFTNLAVGSCDFEVSALDPQGEPLCSVTASIPVTVDGVNSIRLVLPCGEER